MTFWPSALPPDPIFDVVALRVLAAAADQMDKEWSDMSKCEQVPVVGGPLDGQTLPSSTARFLNVPDSRDMVTAIVDGEVRLFFGQHTYEMKCYARDGERWSQWEHVGYEKPEVR